MELFLQDYEISIILCHKVFLVDLVNEEKLGRVLKINSIEDVSHGKVLTYLSSIHGTGGFT